MNDSTEHSSGPHYSWRCVPVILLFTLLAISSVKAQGQSIQLNWMGNHAPQISTGISWGVPFAEGEVQPSQFFLLRDSIGESLPLQSWPLAYWPDGSLKWVGLSTVVDAGSANAFTLEAVEKAQPLVAGKTLVVEEQDEFVRVNTVGLQCVLPRSGNKLIGSMHVAGKEVSAGGELVCLLQQGPAADDGQQPFIERFLGNIDKLTVEQAGPVRAVVKVEGHHQSVSGNRSWLPFVVRLYFYAGQQTVKMVHTIMYDGDQEQDFIRGLGVSFEVPLDEQLYNRHVRFAGEEGRLWDEPVQPLTGRVPLSRAENYYEKQLRGERIPEKESFAENQQFLLHHWASWGDFKLNQLNSDGFTVQKRTNQVSAWIDAGAGKRSQGMAFAGDVSGGLAVCMRDFWQSYPSSIEVKNARSDTAKLLAWMWSPDAPAMDMRHYDTIPWGHNLDASYEDVQPGFSTATGVGRTTELLLFASPDIPSFETLNEIARQANYPPLLTVSPEYLHQVPAFGVWSLPDRSTPGKQWLEDQLDKAVSYYQLEVEQRRWYGFWDFGDVMHAYDPERHVWRYDIGGYAWDNTELMPNLWLWYSFLRSGREDIFRMAEAMTRHTGEVDVYHLGRFEGLGSRHNVRHWGCGSKEVRIAQATLGRFFYYLTTDERTGDLMRASAEVSNRAIGELDPLRLILDKSEYPTHARMGPDWLALAGNWMTEWERTGDNKWRDKIMTGVKSLANMPYGLFSGKGAAMGYDPETHQLYQLSPDDIGFSHLSVLMGGPEVAYELTELLDEPEWTRLWEQFTRLYGAPKDSVEKEFGLAEQLGNPGHWYSRLPAYYAKRTGEKAWAERAWNEFLQSGTHFNTKLFDSAKTLEPVYEVEGVSTNNTAQWGLNAIQLLELVGEYFPEDHPKVQDAQ
ncbi:hypothetical protein [Gaoshiqia sediminis]|uniref:Tat pathway signal sequence domain protein n=1 Tax=Gaoshiqia sediminis TaxID=2986998 RepID=A0AA41Y3R8_9BACT|nr:hypothetical protein [Gaoshiqia sediminis]MCW0481329.1 hypothetical protein [Gaoshiqia sediminis]